MINIFDKILIIILLITAISFNFLLNKIFSYSEANNTVTVTINKNLYDTYDLTKNSTYTINHGNNYNTFKVEDGYVKMIDANCNDKLCIHQRKINSNFETIVCLPNNLVIEISSEIESEIDSIAQ